MKSSPDPPLQTTIWPIFCTSTLDVIFLVIYLERLRDFTFLAHVHYLLTIYLPWFYKVLMCGHVVCGHVVCGHVVILHKEY